MPKKAYLKILLLCETHLNMIKNMHHINITYYNTLSCNRVKNNKVEELLSLCTNHYTIENEKTLIYSIKITSNVYSWN